MVAHTTREAGTGASAETWHAHSGAFGVAAGAVATTEGPWGSTPHLVTEGATAPRWETAPQWAIWRGQDRNGEWWWYEQRPFLYPGGWEAPGRIECAGVTPVDDWESSLERRPGYVSSLWALVVEQII